MTFKKIFSNTLALLLARIIFRFCNAFVAFIIARYLGVEKFGVYSTALALVNTFLIANDIGATTLLMREGSRNKEKINIYFGNSILIQLFASLFFFIITLIVGFALNYDQLTMLLVIILGSATIIFEFRKSLRAVLRILLKLKFIALLEALAGLLIFSGAYIVSKIISDKDAGLILITLVPLIINSLFIATVFIYNIKLIKPKFDLKKIWPMIKDGYIYTIYNIFYIAYFQISIIMIQYMRGNAEAGLYSAASKLIILLLVAPQMIFQIALPLMFKYFKDDLTKYKRIHKIIFRYLNAFGLPVAVGIFLLAEPIINLVYDKPGYLPAAFGLQIFSIFVIFRFFGNVSGQSLTTIDRQKQENIIQISSFMFLIILNIFMIPRYGFIGAIIATVITEFIIRISFVACDFYYLKQKVLPYLTSMLAPIGAAIIMGIFVYFTRSHLNVIVLIIAGAVIYSLFLWILGFFKAYDLKLFKQLKFKKNKK